MAEESGIAAAAGAAKFEDFTFVAKSALAGAEYQISNATEDEFNEYMKKQGSIPE